MVRSLSIRPRVFRGAKPGSAPSFDPRPNDFKTDPVTGLVKPTHGISVFDNPESVSGKGFVPHEIDPTSIPDTLKVQQRGADPKHFEIMPREPMHPQNFESELRRITTKPIKCG